MNVLADILSEMRLTGAVVVEAELRGRWHLVSQFTREMCAAYFPVPGDLIAYHYVRSGRFRAKIDGGTPVEAGPGAVLLFPHNDRHFLFTDPDLPPVSSEALLQPADGLEPARIVVEGQGETVELFCGFLGSASPEHPLLASLPPLLLIEPGRAARGEWLASSLRFAAEEIQTAPPGIVARLAEMFFGEAVRRYMETLPVGEGGWLAGLRDPYVAKALSIIHSRYAEALDVNGLAREVGLSRSALGERFANLIGEAPMHYCARWRMRVAANLLREGKQNSGNIAYQVGFNSEAAFTRAFKREYGEPPAAWRRRMELRDEADIAQEIRPERIGLCASADGTAIGYADAGEGFPLLQPAVWFHHVEKDAGSVTWRHWVAEASRNRRLIRTDFRGLGLSDRHPARWTFDALLEDFCAVVDDLGIEQFDLLGLSHASMVALAYAARNPERVRKLILYGGYAAGFGARGDPDEIKRRETLIEMGRSYLAGDRVVFGRMLGALYWPGASGAMIDWFNERLVAIMRLNESLQEVFRSIDLRAELNAITADTLVAHSRGDRIIPHACSEELAREIQGARLLSLESENHILLEDETAWPVFARSFRQFLAEPA